MGGELAEEVEAANAAPELFEVLPENWQAVETFQRCSRQWRYAGMGGPTGIDVQAIAAVIAMYQLPPAEQLERLDQVQLIERGALSVMNEPSN